DFIAGAGLNDHIERHDIRKTRGHRDQAQAVRQVVGAVGKRKDLAGIRGRRGQNPGHQAKREDSPHKDLLRLGYQELQAAQSLWRRLSACRLGTRAEAGFGRFSSLLQNLAAAGQAISRRGPSQAGHAGKKPLDYSPLCGATLTKGSQGENRRRLVMNRQRLWLLAMFFVLAGLALAQSTTQ